jgi:hypothetical protein
MSAIDDYTIALNIMARVGLESPDFIKEFARSKAILNAQSSMEMMNAQNNAPVMPPQASGGTILTPPDQSTAQVPNMPPNDQNQPTPMEGNGTLNLPQ